MRSVPGSDHAGWAGAAAGDEFSVVFTLPPAKAAAVLALDDAAFICALGRSSGAACASPVGPAGATVSSCWALRMRRTLARGNEVWVGNAAQTLHPVSGQGFNLGLRDAWQLAETLLSHGLDGGGSAALCRGATMRPAGRGAVYRRCGAHFFHRFRPNQMGARSGPVCSRPVSAGSPATSA